MRAIRNSHKIERQQGTKSEDEENKASNLAKIGGPRTENAFDVNTNEIRFECQRDDNHTGSPEEKHSFTARNTDSEKIYLEEKFLEKQG